MTTATATAPAAAPPKKKRRLVKVLAVLVVTTGIGYAADAIFGIGSKVFAAPTIGELFEFKPLFKIGGIEVTFPTVVMFAMTAIIIAFFLKAFSKPKLVPQGTQNVAEAGVVDFIRNQIA